MFTWIKALLLGLTLSTAAWAQDARDAAIQSTIQNQIDAFLTDDFERAFSYASPSIRQIFRTPENFGNMVRNGYPMVWRPKDVTYGPLREVANGLWQRVEVTDAAGRSHLLDYRMVEGPEGWKISAVQLLPAPDPSV